MLISSPPTILRLLVLIQGGSAHVNAGSTTPAPVVTRCASSKDERPMTARRRSACTRACNSSVRPSTFFSNIKAIMINNDLRPIDFSPPPSLIPRAAAPPPTTNYVCRPLHACILLRSHCDRKPVQYRR